MGEVHGPSRRRAIITGYLPGNLTTGDGKAGFVIPFKAARLVGFGFGLDVGGTTGQTDVMLNRVRNESDAELLSAALSIAHDAATVYSETRTTFQNNQLEKGDIVRLDLDAVTTGVAPAGCAWWAEVHIEQR